MSNFHSFKISKLTGGDLDLADFKGKVVLLVNVASKCGLTPQYKKLQALYQKYQDQGLEIIGVPCNQFMGQEPGSNQEIETFCSTQYNITFPLTGKIDVNGDSRHPLYDFLAGEQALNTGDIQWNFEKFLIAKDGSVLKRFSPKVEPDDTELVACLEKALNQ